MPALQLLDNIVPISDFNHGKSSAAFSKVGEGSPVIVLRRNEPAYVISTPDEYRAAKEAEEDLGLLMLAMERASRTSLDECLTFDRFLEDVGVTREEMEAAPEVDFE